MGGLELPEGLDRDGDGGSAGVSSLMLTEVDLDDEKEAARFARQWYFEGKRRKMILERRWWEAVEFIAGNHWLEWSDMDRAWKERPRAPHRVRYVGNLILVYMLTVQAKLLRNRPTIEVEPATSDPEDYDIAQVGQRVAKYLWDYLRASSRAVPRFVLNFVAFGTGCLKPYFDPQRGPKMVISEQELQMLPPELRRRAFGKRKGEQALWLGEAQLDAVSPFHLFPDPDADNWEDMPVLMDARRRSLDWIRQTFPERGSKVVPQTLDGVRDQQILRTGASEMGRAMGSQGQAAMVYDLWIRDCPEHPNGRHLTVSGDVVLYDEDLPAWCDGKIPYFVDVDVELPGSLWGHSVLSQLIGPTKTRNRAISQIIENANLTANPPMLMPYGCRVDERSITNKPGERIPYMPVQGKGPEYMNVPSLPNSLMNLPELLENEVQVIGGQGDPTFNASAPANVRTSSGLAQLIKEDDSRLGVRAEKVSGVLADAASGLLRVAAKEYKERRIARIAGDKADSEVFAFTGAELEGKNAGVPGADYANVRVRIDTGHTSKTAKQEQLLNLVNAGLIDTANADERRWLLRQMDWGGPDNGWADDLRDKEMQAIMENRLLATLSEDDYMAALSEGLIGPNVQDDDNVHLEAHQHEMRKPSFTKLPKEIRARYVQHVTAHQQRMAAALPVGAPPPGGGPAAPGGTAQDIAAASMAVPSAEGPMEGGPAEAAGSMGGAPQSFFGLPEAPKVPAVPVIGPGATRATFQG